MKIGNMLQRFSCISFLFKPPWSYLVKHLDLFPNINVRYTMICNHDLIKKISEVLVKLLFSFSILEFIMKFLVTLFVIKLLAEKYR